MIETAAWLGASPVLWILTLSLAGLIAGSFIALVSVRLPKGEPIALSRSRCPACRGRLGAADLIPVISWLALRGRCRRCAAPISRRYPLIEATCAVFGGVSAFAFPGLLGAASALLAWQLVLIAVIDWEHHWLPDRLTLPLGISGLVAAVLLQPDQLWDRIVGAGVGFLALWAIARLYRATRSRDGLGSGDPRLFGAIGAWVGWAGLPAVLMLAAAIGLATVLATQLRGDLIEATTRVPLGSFLAVAAWGVWLVRPWV